MQKQWANPEKAVLRRTDGRTGGQSWPGIFWKIDALELFENSKISVMELFNVELTSLLV